MNNMDKLEILKDIISEEYGITDIFNRSRKRNIIEARQIFFYISHKYMGMTYLGISKLYGYNHYNDMMIRSMKHS